MKDGYSICLNEWALDKNIQNELNLLLIISSLCAEKGFCYATNEYLAKQFDTNETLISRKIKKLEKKGYLIVEYEKKGCEIKSRKIRLSKKSIVDYLKSQSSIIELDKENNIIYTNNTNKENISNKLDISKKDEINFNNVCKEIVDYLNERIGSHYKYTTESTQKLIKARMKSKSHFTIDDFKIVIDKMCVEWYNDSKMNKYLRPETLFGTKFESYLNREVKQTTKNMTLSSEDISSLLG